MLIPFWATSGNCDGSVIVPVSRVSFGFAAGGSEFSGKESKAGDSQAGFPFGGGSGAGVALNPVAFLVVGQGTVRLLPVDNTAIYDRLVDLIPQVVEQIQSMVQGQRVDGTLKTPYNV